MAKDDIDKRLRIFFSELIGVDASASGDNSPEHIARIGHWIFVHWSKEHWRSEEGEVKNLINLETGKWRQVTQGPTVEAWLVGSISSEPYDTIPFEHAKALFKTGKPGRWLANWLESSKKIV